MTIQAPEHGHVRVAMVSAYEPNVTLLREACTARLARHTFTALSSTRQARNFACTVLDRRPTQPPLLVLLDLETAPEPSWWCLEEIGSHREAPRPRIFGLVEAPGRAQAEARFKDSVGTYLPLPATPRQAQSLITLIAPHPEAQ